MASDQLAYAPARPEGDAAHERDDFRLPRQRTGALAAASGATAAAAGLAAPPAASHPAARPTPFPLPDAAPGGTALAGLPTYDPTALTGPHTAPPGPTAPLTEPVDDPVEDAGQTPAAVGAPEVADTPEVATVEAPQAVAPASADAPASSAPTGTPADAPADPGAALCARILGQVAADREAAERKVREEAEKAAAAQAAREAAERKVREQVAAAKAAAEAKAREEAAAAARAEAERLARLAASYIKPVACATLGAGFGETDPWANLHNGQDFTAPTGTPVHAVHSGTVSSAGWAGSDGYRVVLTLDDGTELRYCHLSSMVVSDGRVTTGDTIGRVGATGNVPAPHLHLEVRPGGGAPIDPLPWLRAHDVAV